jgi:adenine-specific DNA methylase
MFNSRQLKVLDAIIGELNELKISLNLELEYKNAIIIYLGLFIDKIAAMSTSLGLWKDTLEAVVTPFGRQAIPFVFDYPEVNIFSNSTGSALNQLDWVIRYIESESNNQFYSVVKNASSGEKNQFSEKSLTAVITDPPYYDAIAYADLSDFFYVWMKRTLMDVLPEVFVTPQTPKSDECTALKHHHGTQQEAKEHFEQKLLEIFDAIEIQTKDIVSIMFAHQSTEAWTTLCNSILNSRMNITGSWAIDSEREVRGIALAGAALASSVTVSAKPSERVGLGEFKLVKNAIEIKVAEEVKYLYKMGFRGADLLTACFGQAVSEFGKYEKVEKGDGTEVTVSDLLELARECAFNALLQGFEGDEYTKFYIGWLQLNGFSETNYDDAAKFVKVGLSINVNELFKEDILIKNGNHQHLGSLRDRMAENIKIGEEKNSTLINKSHKLMSLYASPNRNNLLKYIEVNSINSESPIWRVLTSLTELLPKDIEDHKLAIGLLTNKDQLIREAKSSNTPTPEQSKLILE